MISRFHTSMTRAALADHFGVRDLQRIVRANVGQDIGRSLFDPAVHFDNSEIAAGEASIAAEREHAMAAVHAGDRIGALQAFGRLLHTRQDFYAHTNWVQLWVERQGGLAQTRPDDVALCLKPLDEPELRSGRASVAWFLACNVPGIGPLIARRYAPVDSHEAMNLDHPGRGPLFPYALAAATNHTRQELGLLLAAIGAQAGAERAQQFLGR